MLGACRDLRALLTLLIKQQPVLHDDTLLLLRQWLVIVAVKGC